MLNLFALYVLRAFVEGGSVAQAAKTVHRTEPQVSRLLTGLQETVGFAILRKDRRSLVLTEDGMVFYRKVLLLLDAAEDVNGFSASTRKRQNEHVNVLSLPHMADGLLANGLLEAKKRMPGFTATAETRTMREINLLLSHGQFDIALTQAPIEHARLDVTPICTAAAVAVMHASHPLAACDTIGIEDLRPHAMVLGPLDSLIRTQLDLLLGAQAFAPHFEVSSGPMAARLATQGIGVALVDPFTALTQLPAGAVLKRFQPDIMLNYCLAFPKEKTISPATECLVAALKNEVARQMAILVELIN